MGDFGVQPDLMLRVSCIVGSSGAPWKPGVLTAFFEAGQTPSPSQPRLLPEVNPGEGGTSLSLHKVALEIPAL